MPERPVPRMMGAPQDVAHHRFKMTRRRPDVQARGAVKAGVKAAQGLPTMPARLSIPVARDVLAAVEAASGCAGHDRAYHEGRAEYYALLVATTDRSWCVIRVSAHQLRNFRSVR